MQAQGLVVQVNVSMCVLMTGHPGDNCAPGFLEPFTKKCLKCTKNAYSDPRNPGAGRGWRGGGGGSGAPRGRAPVLLPPHTFPPTHPCRRLPELRGGKLRARPVPVCHNVQSVRPGVLYVQG